jgi:NitT/TauT family transport system permease protein
VPDKEEERSVATQTVEAPRPLALPDEDGSESSRKAPHALAVAACVLSPAATAGAALLAHQLLPSTQLGAPQATQAYPLVLQGLLAVLLLLALMQWVWRPVRHWIRHHSPLLAVAVLALAAWDLVTLKLGWMPLPYFPGPDTVFQALYDDRARLWLDTKFSLELLFTGYAIGVVAGLISGILMGWYRGVRYWGMPVLKVIGPIPATAYIPLGMVLFSSTFNVSAALIALGVWFPVTMLTNSGIVNVPVSYFDVARTLGAGRLHLIFRVALPAAMPSIFIGLFVGLVASFLTLNVAETIGVKGGLGYYLQWQKGVADFAKVYADLIIMAVFFSGIMTLLFKVRSRALRWQKGMIRW